MNDLVSIIVPIYNVEQYLNRCVESIVRQTYDNIEVLLVNDGSTDRSIDICEKWARADARIRVFDKTNGGLSDARNYGLCKASGAYVLFVDSDDWIHEEMLQQLMSEMKKSYADIVCCGLIEATDAETSNKRWFKTNKVFSGAEAMSYLIDNDILTSHVMPKLYRRDILGSNLFPKGKLFEDIYVMHNIFAKCNSVAVIPECLYYYYVRDDSISNKVALRNRMAWVEALQKRYDDVKDVKDEYREKLMYQIANVYSLSIVQNKFREDEIEKEFSKIKELQLFLKEDAVKKAVKTYASKKQYIIYMLARIFSYHIEGIYQVLKHRG